MKRMLLFLFCFFMVVHASTAGAQTSSPIPKRLPPKKTVIPADTAPSTSPAVVAVKPKYVPVNSQGAIRINYGFPGWNKSTSKVDAASMIMREGVSGRVVQIHLEETEPDSSIFSGLFSINWQNIDQLKVEFFVPPQDLFNTADGLKKIAGMIADGKLKRSPFILRRTPSGAQTIEVFDTREQAQSALRAYRAEQQLQLTQNQKFPSDQEVETAKLAEELQAKATAVASQADRVRMEQLEAARMATLKAEEAALDAAEKTRRREEAAKLAAEGLALYKEGKFAEAVPKFERAVNLDPENRSHYFQYGVALYKIENFNKSLVYVRMAEGPTVNPVEKDFFTGLDHFRLKEYDNALAAFDRVAVAKDAEMSPAATFYRGVIFFEGRKWDDARPAFQSVLDTSKDPQLDNRAESYLEQILRIQQFEREKSRKWQISATLGEQYDSNVLLISDSSLSQGAASNNAGYRSLLTGSVRYRPVYEETREFAVQLDVLSMYTLSDAFKYDQSLRNADPTVLTLTLPWTYKGLAFGKGYKFDFSPGYESILMSAEDSTSKEIISSILMNFSNLFVINNALYSNYNVELRRDQSKLNSSTGDNDSTAIKVKLLNSNLHFLTDDKLKILTSEVALTLNQALGKNSSYNRVDLAFGYIQPFYWDTTVTAKLGYFWLDYPQQTDERVDKSITGTLGGSKKISDIYSTGLVANYNANNSSLDPTAYKKWTVLLTFSALYGF